MTSTLPAEVSLQPSDAICIWHLKSQTQRRLSFQGLIGGAEVQRFLKRLFLFLIVCICGHVQVHAWEYRCLQGPEDQTLLELSYGAYEPPEMGAGNQTQALGVRSLRSLPKMSVQPGAQLCEMGV